MSKGLVQGKEGGWGWGPSYGSDDVSDPCLLKGRELLRRKPCDEGPAFVASSPFPRTRP